VGRWEGGKVGRREGGRREGGKEGKREGGKEGGEKEGSTSMTLPGYRIEDCSDISVSHTTEIRIRWQCSICCLPVVLKKIN
jgi:hypothetical protein